MPLTMDHFPPEILSAFFVLVKQHAPSGHHWSNLARVNAKLKTLIELLGMLRSDSEGIQMLPGTEGRRVGSASGR